MDSAETSSGHHLGSFYLSSPHQGTNPQPAWESGLSCFSQPSIFPASCVYTSPALIHQAWSALSRHFLSHLQVSGHSFLVYKPSPSCWCLLVLMWGGTENTASSNLGPGGHTVNSSQVLLVGPVTELFTPHAIPQLDYLPPDHE